MKTREFKKAAVEEYPPYAPAARPSTPGELARVTPAALDGTEPAGFASAESEEGADSSKNKAKLRRLAGIFAALAAVSLLLGNEVYAMFLAAYALSNALEGETRWRVPTLVKVGVGVLMMALGILMVVLWILKARGH